MKTEPAQVVSCCVYDKPQNNAACTTYLFDSCDDPVVHLLLLKRSMDIQVNVSLISNVDFVNFCYSVKPKWTPLRLNAITKVDLQVVKVLVLL